MSSQHLERALDRFLNETVPLDLGNITYHLRSISEQDPLTPLGNLMGALDIVLSRLTVIIEEAADLKHDRSRSSNAPFAPYATASATRRALHDLARSAPDVQMPDHSRSSKVG